MRFPRDGLGHRKEVFKCFVTLTHKRNSRMKRIALLMMLFIMVISCSRYTAAVRKINEDDVLKNAHVGIAVMEVRNDGLKWRVNQNADKYFIPASNIKIVTLYASMQFLPDSLIGLKYYEADTALYIRGTGDPSFLQPEFSRQPVMEFLKSSKKPVYMDSRNWNSNAFGTAWSWNDYNEYYMPERSVLPVYGNVIRWKQERGEGNEDSTDFDRSVFIYSTPEVNWDVRFNPAPDAKAFSVSKRLYYYAGKRIESGGGNSIYYKRSGVGTGTTARFSKDQAGICGGRL